MFVKKTASILNNNTLILPIRLILTFPLGLLRLLLPPLLRLICPCRPLARVWPLLCIFSGIVSGGFRSRRSQGHQWMLRGPTR